MASIDQSLPRHIHHTAPTYLPKRRKRPKLTPADWAHSNIMDVKAAADDFTTFLIPSPASSI